MVLAVREQVSVLFSEPKIPQYNGMLMYQASGSCFSALQRAENSSIDAPYWDEDSDLDCFSALQRAENSSMWKIDWITLTVRDVSVLFSEPKIPQFLWE